jgi:hypothetical protein
VTLPVSMLRLSSGAKSLLSYQLSSGLRIFVGIVGNGMFSC